MNVHGQKIAVTENYKPNCVAGNAATERLPDTILPQINNLTITLLA